MYSQHVITTPAYFANIPMIDGEFDRFELNNDLEMLLRDTETATFYHDALSPEE
ncbi:MAG: hypothetical protein KGI29_06170 [Pseudomonadota bacterium]|nr:hypothetical protein [Pseudomonadota bacterium]MDE3037933.1 hypothetical protein [Pseudomonadota bacterium]